MEHRTRECMKDALKFCAMKGMKIAFSETFSSNLARSRNSQVDEARKAGADYMVFIDDDMTFDSDSLYNLWRLEEDIVSGLTVRKMYPNKPSCNNINPETGKHDVIPDIPPQGLISVDAVGTGFLMIKMSVYDRIDAASAGTLCVDAKNGKPYYAFAPKGESVTGEDYFFCAKARVAGIRPKVDCGLIIGHLGPYPFTIYDYRLGLDIEKEKAKELGKVEK
jgi:hypothetical protein